MDRKQFVATLCCSPIAALASASEDKPAVAQPQFTPCEKKDQFLHAWIQRMMASLDSNLDQATRVKVMQACGRACFRSSHGETAAPAKPGDLDRLLEQLRAYVGSEAVRREGNKVYFSYVKTSRGLRVADGYCLCPILESEPKTISKTYCQCSVGYVKDMFDRVSEKPVQVELLESVRTGGKSCRFLIQL
jgi:hypothetical protein